jgi:hypothetical protein
MSTDGTAWQFIGSTSVSMPTDISAGLAVTNHDRAALNTATFDHVSVSSAAPLDVDIGDVGVAGGAEASNSEVRVSGGGDDIWGTQDAFNYLYTSLINDGHLTATVTSVNPTSPFAKAGLMIRATTDPSSAHVILDIKPDGGIEFMSRSATGATTTFLAGTTRSFPVWLWLERSGATVTGYVIDHNQMVLVGSVSMELPSEALIGLAVTSHQSGTLTTGSFRDISR